MMILGTENPADLMTKYLARDKMDACMQSIGQKVMPGRANKGLDIQGASSRNKQPTKEGTP